MTDLMRSAHITAMSRVETTVPHKPKPGQSLGEVHPHLVAQYHPTLNGDRTIFDVKPGSQVKLWWVCETHGDFEQAAGRRSDGSGCPSCGLLMVEKMKRRPKPGASLGELFPHLIAELHPTLNGDIKLFAIKPGSARKLWWVCEVHGDFEQMVALRSQGMGCPACGRLLVAAAKRRPKPGESLGDMHPHLVAEFHPTLNGDTTIFDVRSSSRSKLWWVCDVHGAFEQAPEKRSIGQGCRLCGNLAIAAAKRKPKPGESLGDLFPHLVTDFHPTLNNGLTIFDVKPRSNEQMWWVCKAHGVYQLAPAYRTISGAGCDGCKATAAVMGQGKMTKKRLILLLESFREGLDNFSLSQAQMLTLGVQAGIARNSAFMQVVNGHSVKAVDDAIRAMNGDDLSADDLMDLNDTGNDEIAAPPDLSTGVATVAPRKPESVAAEPPAPESKPASAGPTPTDRGPQLPGRGEQQKLPVPMAGPVLRNAGALLAAADTDAAEYLVASSVEQLWKAAYQDPESTDSETSAARENYFEEKVRVAFRAEFDAARSVVPPAGWNFEPLGPGTGIEQPLLMQTHVATQLVKRRRIGNWSGTGAGKTVSAILGARLIGAGFGDGVILVVCPNNTLDGWRNSILNCYPDSRISTGGLDPIWEAGTGPRWMVINFDSLSQPNSAELVEELLGRDDVRLDMVAIDEIHLVKFRGQQGQRSVPKESKRRANLKSILAMAAVRNNNLAVLGMSATPLINDLNEARSVLELIAGHEYPDLDTFANTQNCLKMHQQFVLAGTRFMPDYEAELDEIRIEVDCDHLVDDIRALGFKTNPADVEKVLLAAKLPVIVDECVAAKARGKRAFVYVHYVEGIIEPIRRELEAAGLVVGVFTGADKDGLARFTGGHSDGTSVPDSDRVDVLIGSSAISTGVDGLQHVTDTLVFAVLPWTAAEREQIVGRVHRTGQRSEMVRAVTPVTVARSHMVPDLNGESPWSWCRRRLSVLTFKQSVADAVLEGVVAHSLTVSPQKATEAILSWIHRLENQGEYVAVRPSNYEKAA